MGFPLIRGSKGVQGGELKSICIFYFDCGLPPHLFLTFNKCGGILGVMNIRKCDICKKGIKGDPIKAGVGFWGREDFCLNCGKPVLDFLKKHKFIDKEKK